MFIQPHAHVKTSTKKPTRPSEHARDTPYDCPAVAWDEGSLWLGKIYACVSECLIRKERY